MRPAVRSRGRAQQHDAGPGGDHNAPSEQAVSPSTGAASEPTVVDVDFKTVFMTEYGNLVRYLITQGASLHEADDVVQAAFEQALQKWPVINHPRAWLYRVAMRLFLNGVVQLRRRETPTDDADVLDAAATADDPLAYTVRQHMMMEAVQALPPGQRQAMGLRIAEFNPAEIAELLGSTEKAVRQSLYRARITLNEQMKPAWKETS